MVFSGVFLPLKGLIMPIFMISFLASVYSFSTCFLVCGLTREITILEIPFLIIFYTIPIISVFLYCHKFIYKPIKYYEQTYGKTGLGDKYIEKWEELK